MSKRKASAPPANGSSDDLGYTPTIKAYKSERFLNSRDARMIRILCEYQESQARLRDNGIHGTILFFGSARCCTFEDHDKKSQLLSSQLALAKTDSEKVDIEAQISRHGKLRWVCEYMEKTTALAKKVTEWSLTAEAAELVKSLVMDSIDVSDVVDPESKLHFNGKAPVCVSTGGGPGLMEAANKGASLVEGGRSIGMGISLPFEPGLNKYVSKELAFEYHYFFPRKFWMVFPCLALVCTPGGYGTLDELFEVLTLKQTNKVKLDLPVVLLGEKYWRTVLNFEALLEFGTVSERDIKQLFITDSVDDAFAYIKSSLEKLAAQSKASK